MANEIKALTINGERRTIKDETARNAAQNAQNTANSKQNALTFDSAPQAGSSNPVTSDGIKSAIEEAKYTLPIASTSVLGGVMPDGDTITIDENGVISGSSSYSLPTASTTQLGGVKVDGETINIDSNGVISGASSYSLPTASHSQLGGVKVGDNLSIDQNGVLSSNADGSIFAEGGTSSIPDLQAYIGSTLEFQSGSDADAFRSIGYSYDGSEERDYGTVSLGTEFFCKGDTVCFHRTGVETLEIELVRRTCMTYLNGTEDAWDSSMLELTRAWQTMGLGTPTDSDLLGHLNEAFGLSLASKSEAIAYSTQGVYIESLYGERRIRYGEIHPALLQYGSVNMALYGDDAIIGSGLVDKVHWASMPIAPIVEDMVRSRLVGLVDSTYFAVTGGKLTLDIQAVKDAIDALSS